MTIIQTANLRDEIELVKRTVAKGATDLELELFIRQCERTGLDPFARQIYAVKRWDAQAGAEVMQTQVSIDGLRSKAADTQEMAGQDGPYWCGADGLWHDVWLATGNPRAARVVVLRHHPNGVVGRYSGVALFDSYCQRKKNGDPTRMWAQMAPEMLAKCAEALALRKAFPQSLSGLYTGDEMGQADNLVSGPTRETRSDQHRSDETPLEAPETLSHPTSATRTHPDATSTVEGDLGGSEGKPASDPGSVDRMRETVARALSRLSVQERSDAMEAGISAGLATTDEASFTNTDANHWLEIIAKVRGT